MDVGFESLMLKDGIGIGIGEASDSSCLSSSGTGFMNYQPPPTLYSNMGDDLGGHGLFIGNESLSDRNSWTGRSSISHDQQPEIEMENYRRRSSMARKRRQKISEMMRCLQKILPWDKKMDIATMLEEAYKYVQFLQAQLLVLQTMPNTSSPASSSSSSPSSRQQVLEVVVNSKVAQTLLSSREWCVYSVEQLILLMTQIQGTTKADDDDDDGHLLLYQQQPQLMLADQHLLYQQQQHQMLADDDLKQMLFAPPSLSRK